MSFKDVMHVVTGAAQGLRGSRITAHLAAFGRLREDFNSCTEQCLYCTARWRTVHNSIVPSSSQISSTHAFLLP
jgi:hypothetical protein